MQIGIIYALLAAFCQGLAYTIMKKASDKTKESVIYSMDVIWGLLIWIPFALISGVEFDKLSTVLPFALISAIVAEAFVFFVLFKGKISISAAIFSTYPVFTAIFSRIFNQEELIPYTWFFIAVTIIGVFVLSIPKRVMLNELINPLALYPLAGAISVGVSDSLSKRIIENTSESTFLFCLAVVQVPVALVYLRLEKQRLVNVIKSFCEKGRDNYSMVGSLIIVISLIFFWMAFKNTLASVASTITASHMIFVLIFSRIFLKENVSRKEKIGIILILLGVVGVGLTRL